VVRYHRTHPRSGIDRWLLSASVTPAADGGRALSFGLVPLVR
jgi:hypothetical protein